MNDLKNSKEPFFIEIANQEAELFCIAQKL